VSTSNPSGQASKRVPSAVLLLSLALVVSTAAAIVFAVLYFTKPGPGREGPVVKQDTVLEQRDAVLPKGKFSDTVIYPIPYRTPPSLKLTSANRQFGISKQDEKSFTWMAQPMVEDIKDDKGFGAEALARKYPLWYLQGEGYLGPTAPAIEDFTWEAKGLPATSK
jgi:hypothetical protein